VTNNQQEKLFSNKFIQNFLDDEPALSLQNKYKFAEIASSLAYYLKTFSNINKLLDYICLIFKHVFNEKIIFIIPLNYEGEIWFENIKISANDECFKIQEEIKSCINQFNFSKNFKIKEIFKALKLRGIPTTIIVNQNSLVISKHEGILKWGQDEIINKIKSLFY